MKVTYATASKLMSIGPVVAFFAMIAVAVYLIGWALVRVDRERRSEVLQLVSAAAKEIDVRHIRGLSASQADLFSPQYRAIKEQLAVLHAANPQCRFVYLLGRSSDWPEVRLPVQGRMFFFADSEPEDSKDYSPPGQSFDEDTAALRRVFESQAAAVEGPVADRWGRWISALAPLTDPATGKAIAVLGMDIEAGDWRWDVAMRAALPIGLILVILIIAATVMVARSRVSGSGGPLSRDATPPPEPILRQLLPQLAALFVVLLTVMGAILCRQHRLYLAREIDEDIDDVCADMHATFDQEAAGMRSVLRSLAEDEVLKRELRARDTGRLLAAWQPVFEDLRQEALITHFYFHGTNRVCLLRLHQPERNGDMVSRQTLLRAERSGKSVSGFELGSLGTLTLRVVQPVYAAKELLGYVELGKEVGDALRVMSLRSCIQLAVVLRKSGLARQDWEQGMGMLGRPAKWDQMAEGAVAYVSSAAMAEVLASEEFRGAHLRDLDCRDVTWKGKRWKIGSAPLRDVSGKEVADFIVLRDLTRESTEFRYLLTLASVLGLVILALLISVVYVVLSHTDAGTLAQQATLRQSEERFAQLAEQSRTITWEVDAQGLYTYVSHVAEQVWGYRPEELVGRKHFYDLHPEDGREAFRREAFAVFEKRLNFDSMVNTVACRDGHLVNVATYGMPILKADGTLLGYRGSDTDVTERRRAEEALQRTAAKLKAMALRLQAVREEERAALARELHDTLAQQLTVFALQIELVAMDSPPKAGSLPEYVALYDRIVAMVPQVERLTEQTQKICTSLRPCVLDNLGLVAAIEWLVEDTAKTSGLDCRAALPDGDALVERDLALALFRVVQEALDNVIRHAQATRASVSMVSAEGGWVIEIVDNGIGLKPDTLAGESALGLLGMRERVSVFGGTVDFLSEKGQGTTVRVWFPDSSRSAEQGGAG